MTTTDIRKSRLSDRIGAFTTVPDSFINDATISHEAFRLFVVLRQFTGAKRDIAFPDYRTLKSRTGIGSFSTIANAVRELESRGWLKRQKRFGASTIYTLVIPTPAVAEDDSSLLHGVECSATPDVGQSYTRVETNQRKLTRGKLTRGGGGADAPPTPTVLDIPESALVSDPEALERVRQERSERLHDDTLDAPQVKAWIDVYGSIPTFFQRQSIIAGVPSDQAADFERYMRYWRNNYPTNMRVGDQLDFWRKRRLDQQPTSTFPQRIAESSNSRARSYSRSAPGIHPRNVGMM